MDGIDIRIIKNLTERVHPVGPSIVLRGIDDIHEGLIALNRLVSAGHVEHIEGLYRLSFEARNANLLAITRVK